MAIPVSAITAVARATVRERPITFTIKRDTATFNNEAQPGEVWITVLGTLVGLLAWLSPDERDVYQQVGHDVNHRVLQAGDPYSGAKPGDRLVFGPRSFYIEIVENRNGLTNYLVKEQPGFAA